MSVLLNISETADPLPFPNVIEDIVAYSRDGQRAITETTIFLGKRQI